MFAPPRQNWRENKHFCPALPAFALRGHRLAFCKSIASPVLCNKRSISSAKNGNVSINRINYVGANEDMLYDALSSLGFVKQYET